MSMKIQPIFEFCEAADKFRQAVCKAENRYYLI